MDFKTAIETRFDRFLRAKDLSQEIDVNPAYYYDDFNKTHFYHDFSPTVDLASQLPDVQNKYRRRIERFYEIISTPTLFVRYCSGREELEFVNRNYDEILKTVKSFHSENDIVFVYDVEFDWNPGVVAFFVEKDKNDGVARTFLKKSPELLDFIVRNVEISPERRKKKSRRLSEKTSRKNL